MDFYLVINHQIIASTPVAIHVATYLNILCILWLLILWNCCVNCLQDDYRKAVEEYDEKIYFSLKLICVELRNTYVRDHMCSCI